MKRDLFLSQYNITEEDLEKAQIQWEELLKITDEYAAIDELLHVLGKDFIDEYL